MSKVAEDYMEHSLEASPLDILTALDRKKASLCTKDTLIPTKQVSQGGRLLHLSLREMTRPRRSRRDQRTLWMKRTFRRFEII